MSNWTPLSPRHINRISGEKPSRNRKGAVGFIGSRNDKSFKPLSYGRGSVRFLGFFLPISSATMP
jgi:hypothetical protein